MTAAPLLSIGRLFRASCAAGLLAIAGAAAAEPAILQAADKAVRLPDFSYAGFGFGVEPIPDGRRAIVRVEDHGAVANDGKDDSQAILAALAAAHKVDGPVRLRFGSGRYILSEILEVRRSDIVIEGAGRGSGGTELYAPRPLRMVDRTPILDDLRKYLVDNRKRQVEPARNIDLPFSEYSWSGGFIWVRKPDAASAAPSPVFNPVSGRQGERTIRLGGRTTLRKGDIVTVNWFAGSGPESGIIKSIYGAGVEVGSHHWRTDRPLVRQTTRIEAIDGQIAQLGDPLLHAIAPDTPATLSLWDGLTNVGIRDLGFVFPEGESFGHHLEQGYNGIHLTDVFDGWLLGLRFSNAESAILTDDSASVTIRNIVTEGDRIAHYAIHIGAVHNVLVSDLLVGNPVLHSLSFNTGSTKSVFQRATILRSPTLDQHAGANHQNLFDNVTVHVAARPGRNGPHYPLWDGSGAPYWQPGHGRYNTSWNTHIVVESGAEPTEVVTLTGLDEGPEARIIGLSGNRSFALDYRPAPYVDRLNDEMRDVPSLYDYQLSRRLRRK